MGGKGAGSNDIGGNGSYFGGALDHAAGGGVSAPLPNSDACGALLKVDVPPVRLESDSGKPGISLGGAYFGGAKGSGMLLALGDENDAIS